MVDSHHSNSRQRKGIALHSILLTLFLALCCLQCRKKPVDVEPPVAGELPAPVEEAPGRETPDVTKPEQPPQKPKPSPLPPRRSISPGDSAALKLLESGIQQMNIGNLDDAEKLFVQALRISPTNGRPLYYLGILASKQNDHNRALAFLTEAEVHLHGDDFWISQVLLQEGIILKQLRQKDAAIEKLLEAVRRDPANSWARAELEALTGRE